MNKNEVNIIKNKPYIWSVLKSKKTAITGKMTKIENNMYSFLYIPSKGCTFENINEPLELFFNNEKIDEVFIINRNKFRFITRCTEMELILQKQEILFDV